MTLYNSVFDVKIGSNNRDRVFNLWIGLNSTSLLSNAPIRVRQTDQSQRDINKQRQRGSGIHFTRGFANCLQVRTCRRRFDLDETPTSYVLAGVVCSWTEPVMLVQLQSEKRRHEVYTRWCYR